MDPNASPSTAPSSASDSGTRGGKKSADGKFVGRRAKKPKLLAIVTDLCTGCSGAPVCQIYCPVDDYMILMPTDDGFACGKIWVDPLKCVGCKKCITRGPEGTFVEGCPWDAILMIPTSEWEAANGELPY